MRSNSHHLHLFTLYRTLVLFVLFVCGLLLTLWTGNAFAQTQSYTLAFTQTRITAGESVTLTFATPATRSTLDWVGLYRPGDSDQNYRAWAYLPAGAQGTVSLSYAVPGTYEARLFLNNGYTRAVVTPTTLVITPRAEEGSFTLTTPAQHTAGQPITISWTAPVGRLSTRDWVGLYRQGDPDQNYRTFQYLPNPPATAGTLIFTLNEPGSYEARVFRSNSYTRVSGVTAPFTVTIPSGAYTLRFQETQIEPGATTRLTFTAPATRSTLDWVGLYRPGDSDQNYRAWAYLPAGTAGTVSFRVTQAGTYEARAFVNNGYGRVATTINQLSVGQSVVTSGPFLGSTGPPYLQTTTGKIVRVHVRFFGAVGPTGGWNAGRGSHLPDIKRYLDQNPNNMVVYSYGLMPGSEGRDGASLGRCANGEFNTHYQAFAETAKNLGLRKLIIRPGWEYNIGGWPWSVGNNPERRPLYIACWRQFVDTLRRTYPENQFLFDLNLVYGVSREYLEGTYPGNNYVDLVGADIYDRCYASAAICNDPNRRWLEWHQPRLEVIRAFAQDPARNKPFSIPEWGLYRAGYDQYSGGDNPRFIQGLCQWVANPANRVIYYSYFAPSGNDRHPDLAQSPLSLAAFRQYCNGNQRSVSDELWGGG